MLKLRRCAAISQEVVRRIQFVHQRRQSLGVVFAYAIAFGQSSHLEDSLGQCRAHSEAVVVGLRLCVGQGDNCGIVQGCCDLLRHLDVAHTIEVVAVEVFAIAHVAADEVGVEVYVFHLTICVGNRLDFCVERHYATCIRSSVRVRLDTEQIDLCRGCSRLHLVQNFLVFSFSGSEVCRTSHFAHANMQADARRHALAAEIVQDEWNLVASDVETWARESPACATAFHLVALQQFVPLAAVYHFVADDQDVVALYGQHAETCGAHSVGCIADAAVLLCRNGVVGIGTG